jgi:hypothetical protein
VAKLVNLHLHHKAAARLTDKAHAAMSALTNPEYTPQAKRHVFAASGTAATDQRHHQPTPSRQYRPHKVITLARLCATQKTMPS